MIDTRWWESRWFALACLVLLAAPLLWPAIPPLTDLPGHIGRYHIADAIARSPDLQRHWSFGWALIGNLGVDLLVYPLGKLIGVEAAAKLIVLAIPLLWGWGLIRLSHLVHGRLTPFAPIAFALAYSYSFHLGFVNFTLGSALVLHALADWIRMGRRGQLWRRTLVFVPVSCLLWLCHSFAWGMFGLFAFAAEVARLRRGDAPWSHALVNAVLPCLFLALPLVWMLDAPRSDAGLGIEYSGQAKLVWIASLLRDRWQWLDIVSAAFVFGCLLVALRQKGFGFRSEIAAAALIGLLAFLALPRLMVGGAFVDMRMLAPAIALAFVAIRLDRSRPHLTGGIAAAATAFFVLRMAATTLSLSLYGADQQNASAAIDHLPRGAAVLTLVNEPCDWAGSRLTHVPALGIVRRDIFDNEQWGIAGQQLLRPRHAAADPYRGDPSQLVYPQGCDYRPTDLRTALRSFDRGTFTHVWTLEFPARDRLAPDLKLVFHNRLSALYRVESATARLSPPPATH